MQVTFEGQTKQQLLERIDYVEFVLTHDLEAWERKEFEGVLEDYKEGIASIEEREEILKTL